MLATSPAADRAAADGPLTDELARAGLFPSPEHDRMRNVLASPLAGLDGGPDLTAIVRALDGGLCERPRLAGLPGRFLFAIDDGLGDVAGLGADAVAWVQAMAPWSTASSFPDGYTMGGRCCPVSR